MNKTRDGKAVAEVFHLNGHLAYTFTVLYSVLMKRQRELLSPYDCQILDKVEQNGGFYNAHAHLCRANTLDGKYLRHIGTTPLEASNLPLKAKPNIVGDLHNGVAYTEKSLRERMKTELERQIALGTTRLDTNIDATPDLPEEGLLAIRVALELKEEFKGRLDLRIAPTPIFGFKEDADEKPSRWEVFALASRLSDYISLLPEKDDPRGDGRIGYKSAVMRGLRLGLELNKEVQFHTDQMNHPDERGTEQVLDILEGFEQPKTKNDEPWVWVVHMISPSAYPEERFQRLLYRLKEQNVGVIVCPTAAISMRQIRSLNAPLHNSIARMIDLIKMKIPVRLGTDNIGDVFIPQGDGDMLTEVKCAGHAVRIGTPSIWAKLASGKRLNSIDITAVGRIHYEDRKICVNENPNWKPAIE